jgi:hypothetical protein
MSAEPAVVSAETVTSEPAADEAELMSPAHGTALLEAGNFEEAIDYFDSSLQSA